MPLPTADTSRYRPCAGIALFNPAGKVWIGERAGASAPYNWQMPQGGMDPGETAEYTAIRELMEETGVKLHHLSPLGHIEDWLFYDIPKGHGKRTHKDWRGQKQKWFAMRYLGTGDAFDLEFQKPAEFTRFRWTALAETVDLIVPFKRKVYERVASEFERFSHPVK